MSFRTNTPVVQSIADARIAAKILDNTVQGYDVNLQNIADLSVSGNGGKVITVKSDGTALELTASALGSAAFLAAGTAAGNVPVLDGSGKLATSVLPGLALTNVLTVATVEELAALSASYQQGDIFIVTGSNETYVHNGGTAGTLADFTELLTTPTSLDLSTASGTLAAGHGGTGFATYAAGDLLIGNAGGTLDKLAKGANSTVLKVDASGNVGYGKLALGTDVTGTLSVGNGGTGATSLTANGILFGNGTDAIQATAAPTTADTFLKWNGSGFAWAAISTSKIQNAAGTVSVDVENATHANKVVVAANAATDGSKVVATFAATDAADAGERLEFTHVSGEVQIKGVDADGSGDVNIRLIPQGNGQVFIGDTGDGAIQADDDSNLTLAGGTNTGTQRGDLILKGGSGSGANAGGNVYLRGGDSASGTDGVVHIQDASAADIAQFRGVASAVNFLTFTSAATGGDVTIASDGSDSSVDIVVDPKGAGLLVAAAGYDMSAGSALAFATKGYVDGINTALDGRLDALESAPTGSALQTEIDAVETAIGLNSDGTITLGTANYFGAATTLLAALKGVDTQVKTNSDAIGGLTTEVNAIETAVGLGTDGTLAAFSGTGYLNDATTIKAGLLALDTAVEGTATLAMTIIGGAGLESDGTYSPNILVSHLADASSLKHADETLAGYVMAIEESVGLEFGGTLSAFSGTNYLDAAASIKAAVTTLDTQVKAVADNIASVDASVASFRMVDTTTITLTATDHIVGLRATGARTVLLPYTGDIVIGKMFVIKDIAGTASTGGITLDPEGSIETIDGQETYVIDQDYESVTIVWTGENWGII